MTIGVGGSTAEAELARLKNMRGDVPAIGVDERLRRIDKAQRLMREKGVDALWLDVSSSLTYFTGLRMGRSERCHGAVLPARGDIVYLSPAFEVEKLRTLISFGDKVVAWEEDEDPTALLIDTVRGVCYIVMT
jgi:Xaa-Pro dipeptidase